MIKNILVILTLLVISINSFAQDSNDKPKNSSNKVVNKIKTSLSKKKFLEIKEEDNQEVDTLNEATLPKGPLNNLAITTSNKKRKVGGKREYLISWGLGSGNAGLFEFTAGYQLDKYELGLKLYNSQFFGFAHTNYWGPYAKYYFTPVPLGSFYNSNTYIVASIGKITPKETEYDPIYFSWGGAGVVDPPFKSILGGYLGLGGEVGFNRLKSTLEIGLGRMPNIYKTISAPLADLYNSDYANGNTAKCFTSTYYFSWGLVYSF
ncbi:MAG: hypothetical protein RLZZ118_1698 [Bacteroidota bacterium]|jgi:hypothetical protein